MPVRNQYDCDHKPLGGDALSTENNIVIFDAVQVFIKATKRFCS